MKKTTLFSLFMLSVSIIYAQEAKNPFAKYGYKVHVQETILGHTVIHDRQNIVAIGSVLFDTKSQTIVGNLESDTAMLWVDPQTVSMFIADIGRFTTIDPMSEKYYSISPYAYALNNPVKYIDPDGREIKLANNYAGAMENIARIAATSMGNQVISRLIEQREVYTLRSVFSTYSSNYNSNDRSINYVRNPWHKEVPRDGGAFNSMIAMGHETYHAFESSYFMPRNEPGAVSFANSLREAYSLSPLRNRYTLDGQQIRGNFRQFESSEKISDFTTLGNNADKTSYGYSYNKTTTVDGTTSTTTHYMTVSMDKNKRVSFKTYDNEEAYRNATQGW